MYAKLPKLLSSDLRATGFFPLCGALWREGAICGAEAYVSWTWPASPSHTLLRAMKPRCPEWVHNAVFYEIYPQTFYDSDGDGIGDLPGIVEKLDYVKSLGVNAVWLNPFYLSPMRDAGYDVADFRQVDPRYGTNDDAARLFKEAGKRGLKIIIDFVPGHTSIDHPWFKASCDPKPNKYSNWYIWTNSSWELTGDFASKMVHGYCNRDGNFLINFFWSQPALNYGFAKPDLPWQLPTTHPDVQALWKEMQGILWFWLDMGASGFRVDMAGSLVRNDPGAKECMRFWREVRERIDRDYPDAFLVSEWSHAPSSLKAGFHADFYHWEKPYESLWWKEGRPPQREIEGHSFFSAEGKGDITEFLEPYLEQVKATRRKGYISVPVGNHDLPRIRFNRTLRDVEIIYAFSLTMPGLPFLYYGDEIGMKHLLDQPVREGSYPPRNGSRTPMQWSKGKNLGFSDADADSLYLPVDKGAKAPNVASQEGARSSLLNRIRSLVRLRRTEPALSGHAEIELIHAKKRKYPLAYLRRSGQSRILAVLNPSKEAVSFQMRPAHRSGQVELLAGSGVRIASAGPRWRLDCQARSYGIFRV